MGKLRERVQAVRIILLCIGSAIVYGIAHDQITARICVEYFTIGHPPMFDTDSPTLLGLGWGVIATWWVGAMLGVPLAIAARAGSRPKRSAASMIRPIGILLAIMALGAICAGVIGYVLAKQGVVVLPEWLAYLIRPDRHVPFMVDVWAHNASYLIGFIGGIVLVVKTWMSRKTAAVSEA